MPNGLIFIKYNDWSRIDIKVKYPKGKLKTLDKTLTHIFNFMNSIRTQLLLV
ncbi:MAG: hypothetical protein JSV23_02745 [Promethearchaeota archaeon]|nr:MAG: hypothetical protein JSV23_02745 [Candidatus Lokiarchaeota archaeon]